MQHHVSTYHLFMRLQQFSVLSPRGQPCGPHLVGLWLWLSSASFQMFTNSDEAVINKKLPKELLLRWVIVLSDCRQANQHTQHRINGYLTQRFHSSDGLIPELSSFDKAFLYGVKTPMRKQDMQAINQGWALRAILAVLWLLTLLLGQTHHPDLWGWQPLQPLFHRC